MPASYTIRRSVPRNTRRSKPASTPSTCFPSFSINLFMAFPLPRGDLSSNTTNIIREQKTPSPFGCGYAALCIVPNHPVAARLLLHLREFAANLDQFAGSRVGQRVDEYRFDGCENNRGGSHAQ